MSNLKLWFSRIKTPSLANLGNEDLFYIVGWLLVFTQPLFHNYYEFSKSMTDHMCWDKVKDDWIGDLVFLLLFCISKFVLEPCFFFKQKIRPFIFLSLLSAIVLMFVYCYAITGAPSVLGVLLGTQFLTMVIMSVLVMATSLCINIIFHSRREMLLQKVTEADKVKTELDYLKYQINPHFFMNTLNNIHALVDIDGQLAKDAIIELSRMMRYMLYETSGARVPLHKELEFHRHFVQLMRLRCDDSVSINYADPPKDAPYLNTMLPPLIGIVFIENAFKHGISHHHPSYINISYEESPDNMVHFHCQNSNFSREGIQKKGCGLGLVNVRKRLDLLFGKRYKLNIDSTEKDFTVDLYVPLN